MCEEVKILNQLPPIEGETIFSYLSRLLAWTGSILMPHNAANIIRSKRKEKILVSNIESLVLEAKKLDISLEEINTVIYKIFLK